MKVEFLPNKSRKNNVLILDYDAITPKDKNTLNIFHYNQDDGYYCYSFQVKGSDTEIKVIKEFCFI